MELRDIEEAAREQGFRIGRTKQGHPVFYPPDPTKDIVVGSGTPGDVRRIRNMLSRLRRVGLVYPPGRRGKK